MPLFLYQHDHRGFVIRATDAKGAADLLGDTHPDLLDSSGYFGARDRTALAQLLTCLPEYGPAAILGEWGYD